MDKLAELNDDVVFVLINTRGIEDAKQYKVSKNLSSAKLIHAANRPHEAYGLKYIPHKVVIGSDGKVVKNYDNVHLEEDIRSLA